MKTATATTTRLIDSPTLAVILTMIVAAIVLVMLAFNNVTDDEPMTQVSFDVAPPPPTTTSDPVVASTKKRDLISIASQVHGATVHSSSNRVERGRTSPAKEPQVAALTTPASKAYEEHWAADDSAAGTAPDALH